jgi:hypothetical protein
MLSSEDDGGNSGSVTPMISADSTRVETDERRRWWEFGLGRPTSEEGLEPDGDRLSEPNEKTELAESEVGRAFADIEPERECERPEVDVGDDGIVWEVPFVLRRKVNVSSWRKDKERMSEDGNSFEKERKTAERRLWTRTLFFSEMDSWSFKLTLARMAMI